MSKRISYEINDVDSYPAPSDLRDPNTDTRADTRRAAYMAGLNGRRFLGIWTQEASMAYMQGLAEREIQLSGDKNPVTHETEIEA